MDQMSGQRRAVNGQNPSREKHNPAKTTRNAILALMIILFAIGMFLAMIADRYIFVGRLGEICWPAFMIFPAALLYVGTLSIPQRVGLYLSIFASMTCAAGIILLVHLVTGYSNIWVYGWTLIFPTGFGLALAAHGRNFEIEQWVKAGKTLTYAGVCLFIGAVIFFEMVIGIGGHALPDFGWPIFLFAVGLLLLVYVGLGPRRSLNLTVISVYLLGKALGHRRKNIAGADGLNRKGEPGTIGDETKAGISLRWLHLEKILPDSILSRLYLSQPNKDTKVKSSSDGSNGLAEPLSARELEVLHLIDAGLSNQQIADKLSVANSTVKTHINNIYGKLGVVSRLKALSRARELGLLDT